MTRVGIKDVAREAGVSPTTVSLVLSGNTQARIPDATRERVRDVATRIGYSPNSLAQSLRTRRTRTIGLISDQIATTPFAVRMIEAAQDVAREQGFLIILVNTGSDPGVERDAIDTLLAHQVAGMIYACMWHQVVPRPPRLPAGSVFLDSRPAERDAPAVVPDDYGGAVAAVQELVAHGHSRIAYIACGEHPIPVASQLRHEGYQHALRAAGIEPDPRLTVDAIETTATGGLEMTNALLDLPADVRPTAVFCFNDRVAMGAYRAARLRGLAIPLDLSIVGFDDQQHIAAALDPPLTTVALPHYEMGRWAMEVLLGLREAPATNDGVTLMPCPLVRRESVAPPPAMQDASTGGGV